MNLFQAKEEKKVEYLELIYDLIFVYIAGRNNSLLHNIENGFVSAQVFCAYILSGLAIIQIWAFSTFYTNMHGKNGVRDHIFMFVNMYLLYYIGEGTRVHLEGYQAQYYLAWALILINISVQYIIEYRRYKEDPDARKTIRGLLITLLAEAAIILIAVPLFPFAGVQITGAAILFGIAAPCFFANTGKGDRVDFTHLSERVMLYVVFTFGEMIIAISSYFEGGFTLSSFYFAGMCFLIVVGLFLCYELLYNRIIDREMKTTGMNYMLLHIFLIFAMNNITTSLEFMRDEEVSLIPKTVLLVGSFLLLFGSMFALLFFAKREMKRCRRFIIPAAGASVVFILLMFVLREKMYANIIVSAIYVFSVFFLLFRFSRQCGNQKQT